MNLVKLEGDTASWLLQQKKEENILSGSVSLHLWHETFTVGGCVYMVCGAMTSSEVQVYKQTYVGY